MSWKEDLVKKINALKDEDFIEGKATIDVPILMPWNPALFVDALLTVNLYAVGWVGPGYLKLAGSRGDRTPENLADGVLTFVVSRDRKFNEIRVEGVVAGHAWTVETPIFASVDFMSL